MSFTGQRALILGLAREGLALARFLCEHGAKVTVTDAAPPDRLAARLQELEGLPVTVEVGGDRPDLLRDADVLYVSPGVPESNPVYVEAVQRRVPVRSMTTVFFDLCPGRIIGITGSSGKTTTTGLIGHILETARRDVVVGGNIGLPMIELLPRIGPGTLVVLELSSFQLAILERSPHVAVVTNISPNHLDRHGTMEAYVAAKRNIVAHQSAHDVAVLNASDSTSERFAEATAASVRWFAIEAAVDRGAAVRGGVAGLVRDGEWTPVIPLEEIPLLGAHNVENVLAAVATAALFDVVPAVMADAIRSYTPPAHRLQVVGERAGVRFVDDSIATSPARAAVALRAIDAPILLIAGGRDKRLPWEEWARLAVHRVRGLYLIGEAAEQIERTVLTAMEETPGTLSPRDIRRCRTLEAAVQAAAYDAAPGDVVLLSPGCTSYDMFTDFEERGAAFAAAVEALNAA